jgi:thioredoxin-dependent peroxiredoxin
MLSDPNRVLIEQLGAKNVEKNSTTRSHFVFERGTGKLLDARIGVKADERCVKSVSPFLRISNTPLTRKLQP